MTYDLLYPFTSRADRQNPWRASSRFDPAEPRRFGGVRAGALSAAAQDQVEARAGRKTPGMAERAARYSAAFLKALGAYICVKRALWVWERPLQEGYRPRDVTRERQRRHWFWRTPPPTKSEWGARTARYGFDIRATSPTYIQRSVYAQRAKHRAALAGPLAQTPKPRPKAAFIGPPAPRDYKEPDDFLMVWPPVFIKAADMTGGDEREEHFLPSLRGRCWSEAEAEGACDVALRAGAQNDAPQTPSERRDLSQTAPPTSPASRGRTEIANTTELLSQYHWAVAQFGARAGEAFAGCLSAKEQIRLDAALAELPP